MTISRDTMISDLRSLGLEGIVIRHQPLTARYLAQASASLRQLLEKAKVIGWREVATKFERSIETVLFCNPAMDEGSCGLYGCFRIHYRDKLPFEATFFCFYNGEDKSPCFRSETEAVKWMNAWAEKNKTSYCCE